MPQRARRFLSAVVLFVLMAAPAAAGGVAQTAAASPVDAALSALRSAWSTVVHAIVPGAAKQASPVIRPDHGPCADPDGRCTGG
jgi:hypothetical protein